MLMPSPRSGQRVCSARRDTVDDAADDPAYDMTGQGRFLWWKFLGSIQRRRRCLDLTVAIIPGVAHRCKFLMPPSCTFFPTSPLSQMSPYFIHAPCYVQPPNLLISTPR